MKFSYRWIEDFIPDLEISAAQLERLITVHTAECEGVHEAGSLLAKARSARVIRTEDIPGTHLRKAIVDVGSTQPITVVCGASNCRAGLDTLWVDLGFKTIQGITSNGMLASAAELEIGKDSGGIVEISPDWKPLQSDSIIEIDNKSLTHRPDLWGHFGLAREVAAITRTVLRDAIDISILPSSGTGFPVEVQDFDLCPRFSAIVIDGVTVEPSPWWLQQRLLAVGLNPINNIVDVTNFVMAELAQPMHAFDREKICGGRLEVRFAASHERLMALDDIEYALGPDHGVVADAEGPASIAGVIGGRTTAISAETTCIVLESANWKASAIRKTSCALKVRTDASMRFEKSQDPVNTVRALARALELIRQLCPNAHTLGGLTDVYRGLPKPRTIHLNLDTLNRKLGREVPHHEVREILERLAFSVHETGPRDWTITVPSWRATRDVSIPDDLVEEVGRMIGYSTVPPQAPRTAAQVPSDDPSRLFLRNIRTLLAARGFTEVSHHSFLSDAQAQQFALPLQDQLRVLNPIASDQNLMRSSLIPGLCESVRLNSRHFDSFRLFEIGHEIHKRPIGLPDEIRHVAAVAFTLEDDGRDELLELKQLAQSLAPGCTLSPASEARPFEHPARTASIDLAGQCIGRLFELHPALLEKGRAAILDLNLDAVLRLRQPPSRFTPIRRFPSSAFDLSAICGQRVLASALESGLRRFAGPLLDRIDYLREYTGAQVGENMKSVSFRITLGAADRTLESEEVTAVRSRMIEGLRQLGYEVRT